MWRLSHPRLLFRGIGQCEGSCRFAICWRGRAIPVDNHRGIVGGLIAVPFQLYLPLGRLVEHSDQHEADKGQDEARQQFDHNGMDPEIESVDKEWGWWANKERRTWELDYM